MADVMMRPVLVVVVACGACGARVRTVPHEETDLVDFHLLAPNLSAGTVLILEEDEGWSLPAAGPALCVLCRTLADASSTAGTGWWVPVPSWTPLCGGAGCGAEGFVFGDELEPVPLIVHQPALTNDDLAALAASEWSTSGRLLCPACISIQETRLFETLTADAEYHGMDPLFTLEVPRG